MDLSARLNMVAAMVKPCDFLADIGTDHAYLPIYLYKKGVIKYAVAADISKGSCDKAKGNINLHGLNNYIDVRCGNGLEVIRENEQPDVIVIAGMGGMLAIDVLNSGKCTGSAAQLVLQVQRDIDKVRRYIHSIGYKIEAEDILKEDGKIYTAISAVKGKDAVYTEGDYYFGKLLIESKNPILKEYIEFEHNKLNRVLSSLNGKNTEEINARRRELGRMIDIQEEVLKCL